MTPRIHRHTGWRGHRFRGRPRKQRCLTGRKAGSAPWATSRAAKAGAGRVARRRRRTDAVSNDFLTGNNLANLARQVSIFGILAIGQLFVILTGGIDCQ
jgi:hypothetical protein